MKGVFCRWLLAVAAMVGLGLGGCGKAGIKPMIDTVYLDPGYAGKGIKVIAILPLANTTGKANAEKILGNAIERQLPTRPDYEFMTVQKLKRKCQAAGLSAELESLRRQWVHTRKFKAELARKIAGELKIDAFLVGEITLWKKEDLRAETAGYPHSDVGCRVYLMDARSGDRLWEAYAERIAKGRYYDPTQQEITQYMDETGIVRGSGGQAVRIIEAPDIREVAGSVAADIVRSLPAKEAEE